MIKYKLKFFLIQFFSILSSILFMKYLANSTSIVEFAKYQLYVVIIGFFTIFCNQPLINALRYFIFRYSVKKMYYFTRRLFLIIAFLIGLVLVTIFNYKLFAIESSLLLVPFIYLSLSFIELKLTILNMRNRNLEYSVIVFLTNFLPIVYLVLFSSIQMKIGSLHVLLAILFSNVTLLSLMKRVRFVNISGTKKLDNLKEFEIQYYTYLFPLFVLSVLVYLTSNGGRLIAQFSFDNYSFAFASSAIGLGSRVFLSIVTPLIAFTNGKVYRDSHRKTISKSRLNKYVLLYLALGLGICIFLTIFQTPIGLLFLSPQFLSAFRFIPFAGMAALLSTAVFFYEQHFFAFSRLKLVVLSKLISLASLYVFSLIFIYEYSLTGLFMALIFSASIELLFAFVAFNALCDDNFVEN